MRESVLKRDGFIPNIIIRKTKPLGHYGRLRKAYLEMHRPILFNELVLSGKLFEHCAEIDEAARNRMELIVRSLAEQNGVTEQLKAENQMEWVRQMNACKAQAEEVVKAELIYGYKYIRTGRTNKRKQEVNDLALREDEAGIVRIMFALYLRLTLPPSFSRSTKRSAAAMLGRSAPSLLFMVRFGIFCCRQDFLL